MQENTAHATGQEQQKKDERRAQALRAPRADSRTPADRYEELFVDVQRAVVFPDSKTFVDCSPRIAPDEILAAYRERKGVAGFDLKAFVLAHFDLPQRAETGYRSVPGQSLSAHIDALWPVLTRQPQAHPAGGSMLPLPHPYVVPGGRFAELYYWDSFFTMLGLSESGLAALVHDMTDNFAYLIDTYGHVPNGTRTYYLSRSQPPLFALMTRLCEEKGGPPAVGYLPQLLREHAFWMDGEAAVQEGAPHRRVVKLANGVVLNRYWDDRCAPREESWREDVETALQSARPARDVYRHLRAAAESGWDFSTRWLDERADGTADSSLASIRTTDIVPVDLNCFLYAMEHSIARLASVTGDEATQASFEGRAKRRADAINDLFWDAGAGIYVDYDWVGQCRRRGLTAATVVPLYCRVARDEQAKSVASALQQRLLFPGGLGTTEAVSGEQWDQPNAWAPIQWMATQGLDRYGFTGLAIEIRNRWLDTVRDVYQREGKLVEKYALHEGSDRPATGGGGGEYPLQDGFGWTNGVTRRWLHETVQEAQ